MSFICESCGQAQPVYTKVTMVTTKTREVEHPSRWLPKNPERPNGEQICLDRGGKGTQIVKQLKCCPSCATGVGYVDAGLRAA